MFETSASEWVCVLLMSDIPWVITGKWQLLIFYSFFCVCFILGISSAFNQCWLIQVPAIWVMWLSEVRGLRPCIRSGFPWDAFWKCLENCFTSFPAWNFLLHSTESFCSSWNTAQPSTPSLSTAIITISAQERRGETHRHMSAHLSGEREEGNPVLWSL